MPGRPPPARAWAAALLACALTARPRASCAAVPDVGTYLEPWYTKRAGNYAWAVPAVTLRAGGSNRKPSPAVVGADDEAQGWWVGFGDVDGDGDDDLVRAAVGGASEVWVVSQSDGDTRFVGVPVWWGAGSSTSGTSSNATRGVGSNQGKGAAVAGDPGPRGGRTLGRGSRGADGDNAGAGVERFVADVTGDGKSDAVVWRAGVGWAVGVSNGSTFAPPVTVSEAAFPCAGSSQRAASRGFVWCVLPEAAAAADGAVLAERWSAFDVARNRTAGDVVVTVAGGPSTALSVARRWVRLREGVVEAVVQVEPTGDWLVVPLTPATPAANATAVTVLGNFTPARIGAACDAVLLGPPSDALPQWLAGGAGFAVCVEAASGYWHTAPLATPVGVGSGSANGDGNGGCSSKGVPLVQLQAAVGVWKYSHGGVGGAILPPATNGHPHGPGAPSPKLPLVRTDFHVAAVGADGAPRPLACNVSTAGVADGVDPACLVMPPGDSINTSFQPLAPSLKSTNINLWQAWHLAFEPETFDGGWGGYDSADLEQARFIFDRLTSVGIEFFITDNTNGIDCDFGNTFDATRRMAAFAAAYNAEPGRERLIRYALSVGVNPLGSATDPCTLLKMEAQLADVWQAFLNTSTNTNGLPGVEVDPDALAAAAYRHPVTGKPVVVLYVEPVFEPLFERFVHERPDVAVYSSRFHVGFSDGNNWRAGLWGWMIDRSCGPPNTPEAPCGSVASDVGLRPSNDTMYVSPAYARTDPATNTSVYGARSIDWYRSQWAVAASSCPSVLVVGAYNDYAEMNAWSPARCARCQTGEESDPWLFWNATVDGLAKVRAACGGGTA